MSPMVRLAPFCEGIQTLYCPCSRSSPPVPSGPYTLLFQCAFAAPPWLRHALVLMSLTLFPADRVRSLWVEFSLYPCVILLLPGWVIPSRGFHLLGLTVRYRSYLMLFLTDHLCERVLFRGKIFLYLCSVSVLALDVGLTDVQREGILAPTFGVGARI